MNRLLAAFLFVALGTPTAFAQTGIGGGGISGPSPANSGMDRAAKGAQVPAARQNFHVGNYVNPYDYDPLCGGSSATHDCATAFTATTSAATAARTPNGVAANIFVQSGSYYTTRQIDLLNNCLYGEGTETTTIFGDAAFSATDRGLIALTGREQNAPCVHYVTLGFSQPPEVQAFAAASASPAATSISVLTNPGYVVGNYVWDFTANTFNAIPYLTTITSITGTGPYTVNLSAPVGSSGVTSGQIIVFSSTRAQFKTLAEGCTSGLGGTGCKYPPVIDGGTANRVKLSWLRIQGAWDGISLPVGGGADIDHIDMEALDYGTYIDGAADAVRLSNMHCWNFSMANGLRLGIYLDGVLDCYKFGRIDGLVASNLVSWQGNFHSIAAASSSEDAWSLSNLIIDGGHINIDSGQTIEVNGGNVQGGTIGSSLLHPLVLVAGGRVSLGGGYQIATTSTVKPISVTGGSLSINGGGLINDDATTGIVDVSAGSLTIRASSLVNHNATGSTPALVSTSGTGTATLTTNSWGGGTGTPVAVTWGTDSVANYMASNSLGSYIFTPPGPLGTYGPNLFSCPLNFVVGTNGCEWTQKAASSASLIFNGLTAPNYDFRCTAIVPGTTTTAFQIQINDGSVETTGYAVAANGIDSSAAAKSISTTSAAGWTLSLAELNASGNTGLFVNGTISHLNTNLVTGGGKKITWQGGYTDSTNKAVTLSGSGSYATLNTVVALNFLMSSGNIAQGSCTLMARDY